MSMLFADGTFRGISVSFTGWLILSPIFIVTQLQQTLRHELQQRVSRAGVTIDEVRLTQRCVNWMSSNAGALSAA
jgi:hypothetical protein